MTSPEHQSPDPEPAKPSGAAARPASAPASGTATSPYQDRIYRSPAGLVGGVLLLGIIGWLGVDAVVTGEGRTPWLALATMLLLVPLIIAYTLRPAVFVNDDRLRVRNPFRVIVLPWGQVASLRSGFSNEVFTEAGAKYQLWALPVSLRARNKAARQESRAAARAAREGGDTEGATEADRRHESDRAMAEMRETHERRQDAEAAQGEVTVRWSYEIAGPVAAGAVLLAVLLAVA
ncbi:MULTISPECIES: PH domain-containing protein [Streptomyces]|uniref:PH domain-containing protein n=1 Tax=Streptomyces edwardsiae TaxID=3075527 RepID=A0ABU2Q4N0_9ACTN|nr:MULTISPECIES: PH domain-containing protein [unclassified Streptomyces]MDT0398898.1 PH domain-containing protein [Streptomyces sp. DSM 41636]